MLKLTILIIMYSSHAETYYFDHDILLYNYSYAKADNLYVTHSRHAETDDFDEDTLRHAEMADLDYDILQSC
jgi:hypothetical protein